MGELEWLDEEAGKFVFACWQNVAIVGWASTPEVDVVHRLADFERQHESKFPAGWSTVHLVAPHSQLPSAETREAFVANGRNGARQPAVLAVRLAGDGFRVSAMRSVATSILMLVGAKFKIKFFAELEPLVRWLVPLHQEATGMWLDPTELVAVLDEVMEQVERHAQPMSKAASG